MHSLLGAENIFQSLGVKSIGWLIAGVAIATQQLLALVGTFGFIKGIEELIVHKPLPIDYTTAWKQGLAWLFTAGAFIPRMAFTGRKTANAVYSAISKEPVNLVLRMLTLSSFGYGDEGKKLTGFLASCLPRGSTTEKSVEEDAILTAERGAVYDTFLEPVASLPSAPSSLFFQRGVARSNEFALSLRPSIEHAT